ncbi:Hypothetical protein I595_3708 [Croceitalea dokdonensis DOKDO 023]|uniref:Uncharacterized protein n=1 Tax=Croceitalea dokdonensis DOKDO 023 TaxID=1300341 RepID=A0A0P7AAU8_9FLAO|nr:Hypothetical protein I595_3708 [Croceitalea dokdonensis DOKDO 023]
MLQEILMFSGGIMSESKACSPVTKMRLNKDVKNYVFLDEM